jgi:hypothetical protein
MDIVEDVTSAQRTLAGDLSPRMRQALETEIALLTAGDHDLTDSTVIIIVEAHDDVADIDREVGALFTDIDGHRFDHPDFQPPWDILTRATGVCRMVLTYGSTFATILLVPDDSTLADLCRQHAA